MSTRSLILHIYFTDRILVRTKGLNFVLTRKLLQYWLSSKIGLEKSMLYLIKTKYLQVEIVEPHISSYMCPHVFVFLTICWHVIVAASTEHLVATECPQERILATEELLEAVRTQVANFGKILPAGNFGFISTNRLHIVTARQLLKNEFP